MVERKEYLDELIGWKDEQVIKAVTGIHRCGKSTLLAQYQTWLKENGIADAQIVSINFEELEYEELLDYKKLYAYLKERLIPEKNTYIFLDEIQKVADFEKVVDSLYVKPNVDIYITGSNAYMLSGDLATLLTGRYVEIKMLPLSLKEFLTITGMDEERGFAEYLKCGGLPYVARMGCNKEKYFCNCGEHPYYITGYLTSSGDKWYNETSKYYPAVTHTEYRYRERHRR